MIISGDLSTAKSAEATLAVDGLQSARSSLAIISARWWHKLVCKFCRCVISVKRFRSRHRSRHAIAEGRNETEACPALLPQGKILVEWIDYCVKRKNNEVSGTKYGVHVEYHSIWELDLEVVESFIIDTSLTAEQGRNAALLSSPLSPPMTFLYHCVHSQLSAHLTNTVNQHPSVFKMRSSLPGATYGKRQIWEVLSDLPPAFIVRLSILVPNLL